MKKPAAKKKSSKKAPPDNIEDDPKVQATIEENIKEKNNRLKGKLHFHVYILFRKAVLANRELANLKRFLQLKGLFIDVNIQDCKDTKSDWLRMVNYLFKCMNCPKLDSSIFKAHGDKYPRKEDKNLHTDCILSSHILPSEELLLRNWRTMMARVRILGQSNRIKQYHFFTDVDWDRYEKTGEKEEDDFGNDYLPSKLPTLANLSDDDLKRMAGGMLSTKILTMKDNAKTLLILSIIDYMQRNGYYLKSWEGSSDKAISYIFKTPTYGEDYHTDLSATPEMENWRASHTVIPYGKVRDFVFKTICSYARDNGLLEWLDSLFKYGEELVRLMNTGSTVFPTCNIQRHLIQLYSRDPTKIVLYEITTNYFVERDAGETLTYDEHPDKFPEGRDQYIPGAPVFCFQAIPIYSDKIEYPYKYLRALEKSFPVRSENDKDLPLGFSALRMLGVQSLSCIKPFRKRPVPLHIGKKDCGKSSIPLSWLKGIYPGGNYYRAEFLASSGKPAADLRPWKLYQVANDFRIRKTSQLDQILLFLEGGEGINADSKHLNVDPRNVQIPQIFTSNYAVDVVHLRKLMKGKKKKSSKDNNKKKKNKEDYEDPTDSYDEDPRKSKASMEEFLSDIMPKSHVPTRQQQTLEASGMFKIHGINIDNLEEYELDDYDAEAIKQAAEDQAALDRRFCKFSYSVVLELKDQDKDWDNFFSNPIEAFKLLYCANSVRMCLEVETGEAGDCLSLSTQLTPTVKAALQHLFSRQGVDSFTLSSESYIAKLSQPRFTDHFFEYYRYLRANNATRQLYWNYLKSRDKNYTTKAILIHNNETVPTHNKKIFESLTMIAKELYGSTFDTNNREQILQAAVVYRERNHLPVNSNLMLAVLSPERCHQYLEDQKTKLLKENPLFTFILEFNFLSRYSPIQFELK